MRPTPEAISEALRETGGNNRGAAALLGVAESSLRRWRVDPAIQKVMTEAGTEMVPQSLWLKTKGYSIQLRPKQEDPVDVREMVETMLRAHEGPIYPQRPPPTGGGLLVMDLADVHIGKLCVENETGYVYDQGKAIHRMLEGTRGLLAKAKGHGIGRILMVLGNDILHTDNILGTTSSGTPQDTAGSMYQMYAGALQAYRQVIELLAEEAPVDLIFVPSNHDQLMGWALAGAVAAEFSRHPRVHSTPYNLSPRDRKYYRFEQNLIGLAHGHGEKEKDLYALMVTEAREHISACPHRYWYRHHTHHKVRGRQGVAREKDHIGMTMIQSGRTMQEGDVEIEVVRSPSAPDRWHALHGYVSRQAVECFIHDPWLGQTSRFTEWF